MISRSHLNLKIISKKRVNRWSPSSFFFEDRLATCTRFDNLPQGPKCLPLRGLFPVILTLSYCRDYLFFSYDAHTAERHEMPRTHTQEQKISNLKVKARKALNTHSRQRMDSFFLYPTPRSQLLPPREG